MVRKRILTVICIAVTAVSVIGCQSGGNNTSTVGSPDAAQAGSSETGESVVGWEEDGSILGQVTAVEGNEITLALGTMEGPGGQAPGGEMPDGEMPEMMTGDENGIEGMEPPQVGDGETPPEMPDRDWENQESGDTGSKEAQDRPQDKIPMGLNLTGEEQTITVSDGTVYTVDERGESTEGSLADIEVDSILRVVMDGDTVTSITIMKMGQGLTGQSEV